MFPRFWQVTKHGITSYVLASDHTPHPAMNEYPVPVWQAFNNSKGLYCEIDLEKGNAETIVTAMVNAGRKITEPVAKEFLSDAVFNQLLNVIKHSDYGTYVHIIENFSLQQFAWIIYSAYGSLSYINIQHEQPSMEQYWWNMSKFVGKAVGGLEEPHRPGSFAALSNEQLISMLEDVANESRFLSLNRLAQTVWQKLFSLNPISERYLNECLHITSRGVINTSMMKIRNVKIFDKMKTIMAKETSFFIVGYGHIDGPDNLLDMLREDGCSVKPLVGIKPNAKFGTLKRQVPATLLAFLFFVTAMMLLVQNKELDLFPISIAVSLAAMGCFLLKEVWNRCHFLAPNLTFFNRAHVENVLPLHIQDLNRSRINL